MMGRPADAGSYRDDRGARVELGEELGEGGEGSVFAVRGKGGLCAKIYRADKAAQRAGKIRAMVANKPSWLLRRSLGWPVSPLYGGSEQATFAGFVMPLWRGAMELYRLIVPDERMAVAGFLDARDLCLVAARIARIVEGVHRMGHAIGDLKPQNVLVAAGPLRVAIIDTDSFHIHDPRANVTYPTEVVTPEYAAPELSSARAERTAASDVFALAVLAHQILLGGAHPFEGAITRGGGGSADRIPERIRRGLCPLVPGVRGIVPAAGALPISLVHEDLRALFARAFGQAPSERPSAKELRVALERAAGAMIRCEVSASHRYDRALAACPWCARKAEKGIDLFAPEQGFQRAFAGRGDLSRAPEEERRAWMRRHIEGRLVRGAVTAAERAFLEKTGASLGLDKASVGRMIAEESAPRPVVAKTSPLRDLRARALAWRPKLAWPSWPFARITIKAPRRLGAAALAISAGSAGVAGLMFVWPKASAASLGGEARPECAVLAEDATIGNTKGKGAFLRAAPSPSSDRLALPEGTAVRLLGRTEASGDVVWSEVYVPSAGRGGWVASRYVVVRR